MKFQLSLFLITFTALYALAVYYVGRRGCQYLSFTSSLWKRLYWLLLIVAVSLFPLGRMAELLFLPKEFADNLVLGGSYWLAILYYLFLTAFLTDALRFIHKRIPILPPLLTHHPRRNTGWIVTAMVLLVAYGAWNAQHPITRHYDITIPKASKAETLQVVMVSDIHLGTIIDAERLTHLVNRINQLEPDIVLLAGDIIDGNIEEFSRQNMQEVFRRLHPPLGVYGILGNHEYMGQTAQTVIDRFAAGNIRILKDEALLVNDSFYLIGRDDVSGQRFSGLPRKELSDLVQGLDAARPLILLDHQPKNLEEAREQKVDLQLSGHTHLGQLAPNQWITHAIYELDWGYLQKDTLQVLVSCGYGTWGPPVRIGNQPEIISITLHFDPREK